MSSSGNSEIPKEKRRRLLVDPEVQSALVRRMVMHWCIFVVVAFVVVGFLQACVECPLGNFTDIVAYAISRNLPGLLVGLAIMPVFMYDAICLTNRFAGPIARLRGMLRSLAAGADAEELRLRQGDFWVELSQEFTQAVSQIKSEKKGVL